MTTPIGSTTRAGTVGGSQLPGPGSQVSGSLSRVPGPGSGEDAKLRSVVRQLEGVFTEQLFKAMRETVPTDEGIVSGGSGEEIFTGLLDQHLAADTPTQWQNGLGEALYRQLRGRLPQPPADPAATPGATPLDRMPPQAAGVPITTAGDAGR